VTARKFFRNDYLKFLP